MSNNDHWAPTPESIKEIEARIDRNLKGRDVPQPKPVKS